MKKILLCAMAALFSFSAANAQDAMIANHLAVNANISTLGLGLEVATPMTRFLAVKAGVSIFPSAKFKENATVEAAFAGYSKDYDFKAELNLKRVQGDFVVDIYPFTVARPFYVAAGFYYGGSKMFRISGQSDELAQDLALYPGSAADLMIGDYRLPVKDNGSVSGYFKTNSVRPYLGIGWGNAIPKHRVNFNVELGVQFMGKMKIYDSNDKKVPTVTTDDESDLSKVLDKVTVWPVLKFGISGKIF